jgi:hypothetical protein
MIKLVGFNISGIPGPPLGPKYLSTTTVFSPFLMLPCSIAATNESSSSNARHLPEKVRPSFPVILATEPSGARLPLRILTRKNICMRQRKRWKAFHAGSHLPDVTRLLDRVANRSNDILALPVLLVLDLPPIHVFSQSFAGDRHGVAGHQSLLDEECHDT